ncbi:hypothetical protein SAMN05428949_4107 [Chitinophaga sp. YR627]|uniref:hypothetical protein n=1 Tax=Chitinophaga sp. YR627 TaxID=1881041 RepID=UPI0008E00477|nr:hypothetical protein [Chitinophaga sp. YR627]SFO00506.1 hypothetical protein SAMN05428949_4107 [Chitinophaga sp. YR627]
METVSLTPAEQALVVNADWIYLKNSVLEKVMTLMGQLHLALQEAPVTNTFPFPEGVLRAGAKISRGERYRELPYIILDYPRLFSKDNIFAFRTMFWWGHYFIATLHLAGEEKEKYGHVIASAWRQLAEQQFQVYLQEDPWQHDFENGNYKLISALSELEFKQLLDRRSFIKLAKPYSFEEWGKLVPEIVRDYALLLRGLTSTTG